MSAMRSSGGAGSAYIRSAREGGLILDDAPHVDLSARLRALPSVERLLEHPDVRPVASRYGHALTVAAARDVLAGHRRAMQEEGCGQAAPIGVLVDQVRSKLWSKAQPRLHRVINATGVVLHTNLGRAPLAPEAAEAAVLAATG